jgi:hypothetical protein
MGEGDEADFVRPSLGEELYCLVGRPDSKESACEGFTDFESECQGGDIRCASLV